MTALRGKPPKSLRCWKRILSALVVASHVSLCQECRIRLAIHEIIGGAVLEEAAPADVSENIRASVFDQLDRPASIEPAHLRSGPFPAPVMTALCGKPPKWRSLGLGARQSILHADKDGSVRLLYIPPGQSVPEHSHNGLEATLVLQGAFSDATGSFGVGDVEIASADLQHQPVAAVGSPCICLAATDAPLKFLGLVPRLIQPLFRI